MTRALVVFGVMAAPATAQLTGNVKSVDTTANRLIVKETGTGTEFPIAVTGQTLVVTTTGKASRSRSAVSLRIFRHLYSK